MAVARATAITGALTLLFVTASCEAPTPTPNRHNLIIISVDTLRPDHLGCYGSQRPTSPTLDAFARSGVLFEDALATSPWTLPSHGSLLTGRYPSRHGAARPERAIPESVARLGTVLAEHGYRSSAIVNSVLLKGWGIETGFDDFEYIPEKPDQREPSRVTERALRWLDGPEAIEGQGGPSREQPFFLFLHYYDVHSDYASLPEYEAKFLDPENDSGRTKGRVDGTTAQMILHRRQMIRFTPKAASRLAKLYDAGIRQLDDQLALLFAGLRERDLWDESFVVLTADHGEEFLEHGGLLHGLSQYRESLAIPLLIAGPGVPANTRIAEPVSLVDVMPTSLSLLGIAAPESLDGEALDILWTGGDASDGLEPRLIYTEADFTYDPATRIKSLGPNRSVRSKRFRLHYNLETRETALFDLEADPWEQVDVKDKEEHRQIAQVLLEHLEAFTDRPVEGREAPELTDSERDLLESLGYLR